MGILIVLMFSFSVFFYVMATCGFAVEAGILLLVAFGGVAVIMFLTCKRFRGVAVIVDNSVLISVTEPCLELSNESVNGFIILRKKIKDIPRLDIYLEIKDYVNHTRETIDVGFTISDTEQGVKVLLNTPKKTRVYNSEQSTELWLDAVSFSPWKGGQCCVRIG